MTNLLNANAATLASLERRVRDTCVVYRDHPLPAGVVPGTGDIGIETLNESTYLHVSRSHRYDGPDDETRNWIAAGTRSFPSLSECLAWLRARLPRANGRPPNQTTPRRELTRLPIDEVTELNAIRVESKPAPTPDHLEAVLSKQVLGQETAVRGLAELAAHHVAKPYPRRPASALLVGKTGTGKTLAAEELALHLTQTTGSEWSYERLDMNEFSERHSVARLFGAPPGYIGYDDGHDLATTLRNNPRTVILFDEIDKANPQLWRSLMNLMDAGRLGGQAGDIDARQAILLFTSNKDAAAIEPLTDASDDRLRSFLRDHGYPPEIVARMGRILVFKTLPETITTRLIVLTVQRIVESYGLQLAHIAPEAVADLASRAPLHSGGRDVEYFIERALAAGLAECARNGRSVNIDARLQVLSSATAELDPVP